MSPKPISLRTFLKHETQKSCIWFTGRAKSQKQRCGNSISEANLREARHIRDAIRPGASKSYVRRKIKVLATLCLCKRRHQGEIKRIAKAWKKEVVKSCKTGPSVHRTLTLRHRSGARGSTSAELEAILARGRQELADMISELCITPRDTSL